MEQSSHSGFILKQFKKLNQCRVYLQIHSLSSISNGNGTYFYKSYYDFHQDKIFNWPTHGLLKDTQDKNNGDFGVGPSKNAPQVIITQPIFKKSVNGSITAKKLDMFLSSGITQPFH